MIVLGVDPGLANMGWALVDINRGVLSGGAPVLLDFGVICTEKSDAKRAMLASDDNVRRAREVWRELTKVIVQATRLGPGGIKAICSESQSIPRNSGAAAKTAFSWGLLSALAELRNLPFLQASPQEIKKVVAGTKDASKKSVEEAISKMFPNAQTIATAKKFRKADREHPFDAVAAVVACLFSEVIRMGVAQEPAPAEVA